MKFNNKMEPINDFVKRKNRQFRTINVVKVKDIGRKGNHIWIRETWTFMPQSNLDEKVFITTSVQTTSGVWRSVETIY